MTGHLVDQIGIAVCLVALLVLAYVGWSQGRSE